MLYISSLPLFSLSYRAHVSYRTYPCSLLYFLFLCVSVCVRARYVICVSGGAANGPIGTSTIAPAEGTGVEKKPEEPPRRKKSRFAPPPTGAGNFGAGG